MAKATATSAAATTITKIANICPSMPEELYLEKATKLMFAEFKINSTPINTLMALRRVSTPKTPKENSAALINR